MKQQRFFSPISQSPQKEVSTKRHSIRQEKEAAKKPKLETTKAAENEVDEKQKVETTKAENEVDEKQQVESTKAENEVDEKQQIESTKDENEISYDSDDDSYVDSDDSFDKLVKSYDGPGWEKKLLQKLYPMRARRKPKDGEPRWKPFRSIPVDGLHEESDASSEELTSPQAVTGDGWSVIIPLSWVKAFWIPLVTNGAHAIGLREKQWIASDMGIPFFPQDFPDCKAYSCFMAAKAAECNEKEELRPPSVRSLRVPILPPWGIVHATFNKEFSTMDSRDLSAMKDLTNTNSLSNSCSGNFKISNFDDENSFDGTVARTGCMLTTLLEETKTGRLLLFPCAADGNGRISKFIKGELMLDMRHKSSVTYDRKLCFIRVYFS
ncbi:ribonuclease Ps [Trifolium repens]|nr:ribonuclease Ps [Trifolium repens]